MYERRENKGAVFDIVHRVYVDIPFAAKLGNARIQRVILGRCDRHECAAEVGVTKFAADKSKRKFFEFRA